MSASYSDNKRNEREKKIASAFFDSNWTLLNINLLVPAHTNSLVYVQM